MAENKETSSEEKKAQAGAAKAGETGSRQEGGAAEKKARAAKKPAAAAKTPSKTAAGKAAKKGEPEKKAAPKKEAKPRKKKAAARPKPEVAVPEVKTLTGKEAALNPDVFDVEPKVGVLHEVVRAEFASSRRGTASTKTRGEVRGGGAKPWRQKGTGRARAGSTRMPHWTGGGVAFGPTPRSYSFKVNRKVRSKALKMALSARAREGGLKIVDSLAFDRPQTAAAAAVLDSLDVAYPLLVLLTGEDVNAALSFRNLPRVGVCDAGDLKISDIMGARTLLATRQVIDQLNKLGEGK